MTETVVTEKHRQPRPGDMRFTHDGTVYELTFKRKHRIVHVADPIVKNVYHAVRSEHPFTTAFLHIVDDEKPQANWTLHRFASVGCLPGDKFEKAQGRLHALRKMTGLIEEKELRRALWTAYTNRISALPYPARLRHRIAELMIELIRLRKPDVETGEITALVHIPRHEVTGVATPSAHLGAVGE